MRGLEDLPYSEQLIVLSICALIDQLEHGVDYYLPAIASARQKFFKGRSRGEKPKGYLEVHQPRVRKRWDG